MQESSNATAKYPWLKYTLAWNPRKSTISDMALYISQIAFQTVLAYLRVFLLGPLSYSGISLFSFVYPFMLVFTMWWGFWGALGSYVGTVIGSGLLAGLGLVPALLDGFADLIPALLVFIVYRGIMAKYGYDPLWRDLVFKVVDGVKAKRASAWMWFILFNGVAFNLVATEIAMSVFFGFGLIPPAAYWFWWVGFFLSDIIPTVLIAPILISGLSSILTRQNLITLGWLS